MVSVTENDIEKPRWWAQAILIGAVIGAVLLVMGGLGTRLGMWSYSGGFTVASGGILLASAGFFLGVIGVACSVVMVVPAADRVSVALHEESWFI